ncbi:MAG: hypothetical protein ACYSTI_12975 [Planctomycetota bacterium]|jgi:hypothetical protein
MNKLIALVLAAVTVAPIFYFLLFALYPFLVPLGTPAPTPLATILDLHMVFSIWSLALLVFYVGYLLRSDEVPTDKRALWGVVLLLGNVLTMPFFWYFYIWRPMVRGG